MSSEIEGKLDIESVLADLKNQLGMSTEKELAEIMGISPNDFNNRKRRGTLINLLFSFSIDRKLDLNRLFYSAETELHKIECLEEIERWIRELIKDNPKRIDWFRLQFEDSFPTFLNWKKERQETTGEEEKINFTIHEKRVGNGWK
jgi:hypothetical protein